MQQKARWGGWTFTAQGEILSLKRGGLMGRYRNFRVEIEAVQWIGDNTLLRGEPAGKQCPGKIANQYARALSC